MQYLLRNSFRFLLVLRHAATLLAVLPRAAQADIIPAEFQQYFQDLLDRLAEE